VFQGGQDRIRASRVAVQVTRIPRVPPEKSGGILLSGFLAGRGCIYFFTRVFCCGKELDKFAVTVIGLTYQVKGA
jgi:hypothetical protein